MNFERIYPALLSMLACLVFVFLMVYDKVNTGNFEKLIDVSINISGILLGFLITLHGILISIRGSKIMKMLQQAGSLKDLNFYLKSAIRAAAILLGFCLVVLIFDFEKLLTTAGRVIIDGLVIQDFMFVVWITLIFYITTTSYRFISLFISIISEDTEE